MEQFKIRCSAILDIMAKPTGGRLISEGAMTYCKNWLSQQLYQKPKKQISSKYLEKGIEKEEDAIKFISQIDGEFYTKNETRYENEYIIGTPDVVDNCIIDIKCSFDWETFPIWETELKNKAYWWQMQGYMAITGKRCARIDYCLMDGTFDAVQREAYNRAKMLGVEISPELEEQVFLEMQYEHLPTNLRYKSFPVEFDGEAIALIEERVIACRAYIESLKISLIKND